MTETKIFDTHAHYDDSAFDGDREELLGGMQGQGIGRIVNIGSTVASCGKCLELADKYDFVYAAIGIHPTETGDLDEEVFAAVKKQCMHPKCVAVGEIGLDYYWNEPEPQIQKEWFVRQLELAREIGKPVVIHSREACKDTLDIMTQHRSHEIGGVVHCYSYSKETARDYLNMGFYFGIGGVLTYKNAQKLKEVVEYLPMDRMVLETDCPYLSPVPFRGKRNSSLNIPYVVAEMARIKNLSEEEIRRATWENACKLYGLEQ